MSSKQKPKKKPKKTPKLGSGMAEGARRKLKNRGQQIDAMLNGMD